jgi:hypothetical protein
LIWSGFTLEGQPLTGAAMIALLAAIYLLGPWQTMGTKPGNRREEVRAVVLDDLRQLVVNVWVEELFGI